MLNTMFLLKYDGDETPTHPWTVAMLKRQRVGGRPLFAFEDVIQMTSLESAEDIVRSLQRGELRWDEIPTVDDT